MAAGLASPCSSAGLPAQPCLHRQRARHWRSYAFALFKPDSRCGRLSLAALPSQRRQAFSCPAAQPAKAGRRIRKSGSGRL
ncbi:hypothetical protein VE23_10750 [Paenibacillus sp. D9]|nr:hypothetical protein VE23_10750 [Paenibacillus sp. D9]CDN45955.1 hypothetical protein BN871_JS_00060 [Paenibacillus sp. P22]